MLRLAAAAAPAARAGHGARRADRRLGGQRGGGVRAPRPAHGAHLGPARRPRLGRSHGARDDRPRRGLRRRPPAAREPHGPLLPRVRRGAAPGAGALRSARLRAEPARARRGRLGARPRRARASTSPGITAALGPEPARRAAPRVRRGRGRRRAGVLRRQLPLAPVDRGGGASPSCSSSSRGSATCSSARTTRRRSSTSRGRPRRRFGPSRPGARGRRSR